MPIFIYFMSRIVAVPIGVWLACKFMSSEFFENVYFKEREKMLRSLK